MCCVPFSIPGGNPPTEEPGLSPRSPVTVVAPVLLTAEPARIAKPDAPASGTIVCTVVWTGITIGVAVLAGEESFFLHAAIKTTDIIARVVNSFFVFICFAFKLWSWHQRGVLFVKLFFPMFFFNITLLFHLSMIFSFFILIYILSIIIQFLLVSIGIFFILFYFIGISGLLIFFQLFFIFLYIALGTFNIFLI